MYDRQQGGQVLSSAHLSLIIRCGFCILRVGITILVLRMVQLSKYRFVIVILLLDDCNGQRPRMPSDSWDMLKS